MTASSGRSKILPTVSACFFVICIWPRHAAVVHSFEWPTFFATSLHLMPLFSLRKALRSVTSSRFIGFISALIPASASRFITVLLQLIGLGPVDEKIDQVVAR